MTPYEVFLYNLPWLFIGILAGVATIVAMIPTEEE